MASVSLNSGPRGWLYIIIIHFYFLFVLGLNLSLQWQIAGVDILLHLTFTSAWVFR